ncbi:aldo/keto reductase [Sphingomonas abietis]|uniref:Aldo/keto reductase n=1 Tax=Sphingomonas abietis TaxID=3012344 RepID=A0ABY7NSC5_9SPHN|nr:aldo/keto reductase [Sphingomonas abietis]WBO23700.1 aldo/keto reductase [Sphingomonas abietis]
MIASNIPQIALNDGGSIPAIGFGTYLLNGRAGVEVMVRALHNGYRLLDFAFNYENEGAVGQAVRSAGIAREEIRIVSKLPGRHQAFDKAIVTIEESLLRAQLDYYDLYLIHWPNPQQGHYVEAWTALIEARSRGLVRSIGVCNFLPEHLETLDRETGVLPSVNQIELHPFFPQDEQRAFDAKQGIVTQAWSPLGRANELLHNAGLKQIADRLGKSIPQVILRWQIEIGVVPVPKATSDERQIENLSIFDFTLSDEDKAVIRSLARADGRIAGQDPATYEEF